MDSIGMRNYRAFLYLQKKKPKQFFGVVQGQHFIALEANPKVFAGFTVPHNNVIFRAKIAELEMEGPENESQTVQNHSES